ncbi:MAG: hypothetical protein RML36_07890 [Anaerolineae bacterium]|nr:hypothetical protein [Anaerolineae bacterium]MDW8099384.1 hypothetical protein [Anaerolineae bacterium]
MTREELLALILSLGMLAVFIWLTVMAARWLWQRVARPAFPPKSARVRWIGRPAALKPGPGDVSARTSHPASGETQARKEPRRENMSFGIRSSSASTVRLGLPRRIRLDEPMPQADPWIRRGEPLVVRPRPAPLWAEKGWRREGNAYHGYFRANGWSWRGRVEVPYPGGYTVYIWDPPIGNLKAMNHPHHPCFMDKTREGFSDRYRVHFHTTPSSLDHIITNIEQILREAMSGKLQR